MEAAQRRFRIMTTNYISFAFFFINIYLWKQDISIEDIRIASGALNVLFDIFLCCFAPMAYLCIQIFHLLLPGLLPFVVFFPPFPYPSEAPVMELWCVVAAWNARKARLSWVRATHQAVISCRNVVFDLWLVKFYYMDFTSSFLRFCRSFCSYWNVN